MTACSMGGSFCGEGHILVGLPPLCSGCYRTPKVRSPTQGAEKSLDRWMKTYDITLGDLVTCYQRGVSRWIRLTEEGATKKAIKLSRAAPTLKARDAQR